MAAGYGYPQHGHRGFGGHHAGQMGSAPRACDDGLQPAAFSAFGVGEHIVGPGVLVLCTGGATKRIEELQSYTKEYIAILQLGATTPSFDLEKPIDATYATDHITLL